MPDATAEIGASDEEFYHFALYRMFRCARLSGEQLAEASHNEEMTGEESVELRAQARELLRLSHSWEQRAAEVKRAMARRPPCPADEDEEAAEFERLCDEVENLID